MYHITYFYPRSPCGERRIELQLNFINQEFLSTLSLRRATRSQDKRGQIQAISIHALLAESDNATLPATRSEGYFYPRSPCGERLFHFNHTILIQCISIHALLAESDATAAPGITACHIISIHALLAESDQSRVVSRQTVQRFLSTLSLRRATYAPLWYNYSIAHFYPRSPCGERHRERFHRSACPQFLSTLSLRRATWGSAAR